MQGAKQWHCHVDAFKIFHLVSVAKWNWVVVIVLPNVSRWKKMGMVVNLCDRDLFYNNPEN
jgi:hypothetical protein